MQFMKLRSIARRPALFLGLVDEQILLREKEGEEPIVVFSILLNVSGE
jgi:hypothetical protein